MAGEAGNESARTSGMRVEKGEAENGKGREGSVVHVKQELKSLGRHRFWEERIQKARGKAQWEQKEATLNRAVSHEEIY